MADPELNLPKALHDSEVIRPDAHSGDGLSLRDQVRSTSRRLESEIILRALERNRWNRRLAAKALQISYRSLLYKMKNCNLRWDNATPSDGKR